MQCCSDPPYIGPPLDNTCGAGATLTFMTLLNLYITNTCDISEICQRVQPKTVPDQEYDFIVVGGGTAGAAAAGRLAENLDWKVLLIEAGNDESPGTQIPSMIGNFMSNEVMNWNYKTEPEPAACQGYEEKRCNWPRGKVLGGCSTINGMMYMRGTPEDFDGWAAAGNEGWSYKDVLPAFKKFEGNLEVGSLVDEEYHGTEGPWTTSRFNSHPNLGEDVLKAAAEIGYPVVDDLNGKQYSGFAIAQANNRYEFFDYLFVFIS